MLRARRLALLLLPLLGGSSRVPPGPSPPRAGGGFVQVSGGSFVVDGVPTRFAGTNALSLAQFADAFERADLLARTVAANLTLVRL